MFSKEITKQGGPNTFLDKQNKRFRTVFILPGIVLPVKDKNQIVIDFTASLFGIKLNVTENALEIL